MSAKRPRLDIDATRERLPALGLLHAGEMLDETLAHAFLDKLLGVKPDRREGRRIRTSLRRSNLPTGQALKNFAFQSAIERSRIETLATGSWIRNADAVLRFGPPGIDKSHIRVALDIKAVQLDFSAQYFRSDELMTALKSDDGLPPVRLKRTKYTSTALLMIDEWETTP